jgi:O-antigen/teichoic acid export membrane protein
MIPVEFKSKVARSAGWSALRVASDQIFSLLIFLLLARLLSPTDFGLVALAGTFIELSKVTTSRGLSEAVIQTPELDDELASASFWSNLAAACMLMVLIILLAFPVSHLFASPDLAPVLSVMSIALPISALGAIHGARLVREFGHRAIAIRSLLSNSIGGSVAALMAFLDYGLWSLVVQRIVADVLVTTLTWKVYPWVPRVKFRFTVLTRVGRFSAHVVMTQLLFYFTVRVQELIIGLFVSVIGVGYFRIGWRMLETFAQLSLGPITTVATPTFARLQLDRQSLERAYLRMTSVSAALTFPVFLGMAVIGRDLIVVAIGAKWLAAAEILQILCLMVLPITLNLFVAPALSAVGRPAASVKIATVQLTLGVLLSLVAVPFGVIFVTVSHVIRSYLTTPYVMWCLSQETGISATRVLRAVERPALAASVMAVCLLVVHPMLVQLTGIPSAIALSICFGGLIYILVLLAIGHKFLVDHVLFLRSLVQRSHD